MIHSTLNPKLSLLIPVYNEENNIENLVDRLMSISWGTPTEFVFVDDASKDNSILLLNKKLGTIELLANDKQISFKVDKLPRNSGKGAAIHRAIELASGDVVIVQDADFEYDPSEIPRLVGPIFQDKADVVYGSRFKKSAPQVHRTFHYFVNRLLTLLSNLASGMYLSDMETCYKAIRRDIIMNLNLKSQRFGFEVEITAHLARLKVRVHELPITYYPRNYLEGKKITWRDGVAALFHIIDFNYFTNYNVRFKKEMPQKFVIKSNQYL